MRFLLAVQAKPFAQQLLDSILQTINKVEDEVFLIAVVEELRTHSSYTATIARQFNQNQVDAARSLLINLGGICTKENVKHSCLLRRNSVEDALLKAVNDKKIDVLVVGRRQLDPTERFFSGSISSFCINYSPVTVWVIKEGVEKPEQKNELTSSPKAFLESIIVGMLPEEQEVVTVPSSTPLKDVLDLMIDRQIRSVPMYNSETDKKPIGFVSISNIVKASLDIWKDVGDSKVAQTQLQELTCKDLIKNEKAYDPFLKVEASLNMYEVLQVILKGNLQRVAVVDKWEKVRYVLTLPAILRLVAPVIGRLDLGTKKIGDLKLGYRDLPVVKLTDNLVDALTKMYDQGETAIAVLDDQGKVVGNVSASDIKTIGTKTNIFGYFTLPLSRFIQLIPPNPSLPAPILCVRPTTTVEELIQKFYFTHVHQLYVVDDNQSLLGVVTPKDILQCLFP